MPPNPPARMKETDLAAIRRDLPEWTATEEMWRERNNEDPTPAQDSCVAVTLRRMLGATEMLLAELDAVRAELAGQRARAEHQERIGDGFMLERDKAQADLAELIAALPKCEASWGPLSAPQFCVATSTQGPQDEPGDSGERYWCDAHAPKGLDSRRLDFPVDLPWALLLRRRESEGR